MVYMDTKFNGVLHQAGVKDSAFQLCRFRLGVYHALTVERIIRPKFAPVQAQKNE